MTWKVHKINNNPLQNSVAIVNDDKTATPTTDYREADKLARKTIAGAALNTKGYTLLTNRAMRVYISQAY